jgi:type I restriction enzyme S subunit
LFKGSYQVRKADKFYFKDGNLTWFKDFKLLPSSIVYCWLNSSIGKEELDNISIGSTQAALTISVLQK